ncbi:pollen-specific leucine-rich repeat extensin-like protein 2 [Nicotiana sylvestris]|uniref:pollen-specific leucine-rich repeat extensin-like protein 2 n=1 Tax=Nicotiana sylvestris TaxID=4096 RepID=UPI00388CAEED
MQNLELDLSSLVPTDGDQVKSTTPPDLGLDFTALMNDTAPPTAAASQPKAPLAHIDKGKQIADASIEDVIIEEAAIAEVKQVDMQTAIQRSLVDIASPIAPSVTPPSVGESSSSQAPTPAPAPAPTPVLDQPESITPSAEVTPQTELSSVPASTSEGDPSSTQPATNSHSTLCASGSSPQTYLSVLMHWGQCMLLVGGRG